MAINNDSNIRARRCVLPGNLQGRSRQFYEDILHVKTVISHFNIEFKGWRLLVPHDDMKISYMLFPISI